MKYFQWNTFLLTACSALLALNSLPAFAMDQTAFTKEINRIQEERKISPNVFNYEEIDRDYRDFLKKNWTSLSDEQREQILKKIVWNAAKAEDPAYFNAAVVLADSSIPADRWSALFTEILKNMFGTGNGSLEMARALELFDACKDRIDVNVRLGLYNKIGKQILELSGDVGLFRIYAEALWNTPVPENWTPQQKDRFNQSKSTSFRQITSSLIDYDPAEGEVFVEEFKDRYTNDSLCNLYAVFMKKAVADVDRPLFDRYFAKLMALPYSDTKINSLRDALESMNNRLLYTREKLLLKILEIPELSEPQQFQILMSLRRTVAPQVFEYGFYKKGSYEQGRSYLQAAVRVADAYAAANPGHNVCAPEELARQWALCALNAYEFGDSVLAHDLLIRALALDKNGYTQNFGMVLMLMRQGRDDEAARYCDAIASSNGTAQQKEAAANLKYFLLGGEAFPEDLQKNGEQAPYQKLSDEEKMKAIRTVGSYYFRAKRFEKARELSDAVITELFRPAETNKRYTVHYLANAPETADAWARSSNYDNWEAMETRFAPYAGYDV